MKSKIRLLLLIMCCIALVGGALFSDYKNKCIDQALYSAAKAVYHIQNPDVEESWISEGHDFDSVEMTGMNLRTMHFIVEKNGDKIYVRVDNWSRLGFGMYLEIKFFDSEKGAYVYS